MITLEGLQRQLLLGLDALLAELLHLAREHGLGRRGRVDTVGLDRDYNTTADLEELMCVETDDTGLIGLCDVGEDTVDHADEHAVLQGVSGVLNDRNDIRAVRSHVDQISAGAVRELYSEDSTSLSNDISDVGDGGSAGGTEVEHFRARLHVDVVHTTEDTGCQLGAEGIPHAVFGLGGCRSGIAVGGCGGGSVDGDALLAVDGLAGCEVLGDEEIFFAASDEDTGVAMRLLLLYC